MGNSRTIFLFFCIWTLTKSAAAQHGNPSSKRQSHACEGQNLDIDCHKPGENSQRIRVVRANYGRFSIAVCNPGGVSSWSTKCMSHTSTQVLSERCNDKSSCTVEVNDRTFGEDPCPDTQKYLEVHYECVSDTTTTPPVAPTKAFPVPFQSRVFAVTTPTTVQTTKTTPTTTSTTTMTSTTSSEQSVAASTAPAVPVKSPRRKASKPEAVIEEVPISSAEQLPVKSPQQATEYCAPTVIQGVKWPKTPKGATAFERCPFEPSKYVEWWCSDTSPPHWVGLPELGNCTSQWIDDIGVKIATNAKPEKLAEELAKSTAEFQLASGGDILKAVDYIEDIVKRGHGAAARMSLDFDQESNPGITNLGQSILRAGSNILAGKHNLSWDQLPEDVRSEKATLLITSMEKTAFMLADNLLKGTILTTASNNIVIGAGKLQTDAMKAENYRLPEKENSRSKNSIEIPAATLKQYSENGLVRVIFLSYNNVEKYLSSAGEIDASSYAPPEGFIVNSNVVSAAINGRLQKTKLEEPIMISFEHISPKGNAKPVCAYWDYTAGKGQDFKATWSTKGCWLVDDSDDSRTICACNHLTNFAVLMDISGTIATSGHNAPLTQITYIGCSISIVCLVITLITFFSFRSLQSERTTIHKNLVFCLLIAEIFFLAGINQTQLPVGCHIFSAIMHYFFLAAFAWSLFEGINIWLLLVEVFETGKSRRVWYYLCGYGGPLIIVATCLGVDWKSYATPDYCWLRSDNYFILSFVVPVGIIIVANIVFLSVALYYMCRNVGLQSALHARDADTWKNLKKWISGALALVFVMSITWIFGFMYLGNTETVIFAYIFTFLNSFQGVFIFVLICLRNDKVKVALRQFFLHQTERLTGSLCGRSTTSDFSDSGTHGGRQGFYQCAPPLDKEQQYIASFAPCWYGTRPNDTSRRNTTTSTLPPTSPAPLPQCTCEHDFPEKGSTRSSNRDSGHESVSCPSAESPPMQPIHIHQRTLYPPSAARKHASQVLKSEYPATAARIAARNAKFLYGDRGLYCGNDEHIYAEIEQQHLEEEVCPYSESDESNTSVYQINGSEGSMEDDHLPAIGIAVNDLEGRRPPIHHASTCSRGSEHKPLINSLRFPGDLSRPVDVRSAFRSLSNPHSHAKLRNSGLRKPHVCNSADSYPYVNTAPRMQGVHIPVDPSCAAGNYNAFGLTATRDGSQMVRRMPMMSKVPDQLPPSYSEC